MTSAYIRTLYRYHDWANDRILSAAAGLTDEQRHRDLGSSFETVHATLVHMLASEWIWFKRWQGASPTEVGFPEDVSDMFTLSQRWKDLSERRHTYIEKLTDEDVNRTVAYTNTKGDPYEHRLWEMMCHAANHATYHRGQITTMIRQLDAVPLATDMIKYFRSDSYGLP